MNNLEARNFSVGDVIVCREEWNEGKFNGKKATVIIDSYGDKVFQLENPETLPSLGFESDDGKYYDLCGEVLSCANLRTEIRFALANRFVKNV